jgi:hypothetical protein
MAEMNVSVNGRRSDSIKGALHRFVENVVDRRPARDLEKEVLRSILTICSPKSTKSALTNI